MELLIIWILCGVISLVVATNKGRNAFGWFVLGVLGGPLGLVLALVVPKNQKTLESQALERGDMTKCHSCAELVRAEAVRCRYCGASLYLKPSEPTDDNDVRQLISELRKPAVPGEPNALRQQLIRKLRRKQER